MSLVSSVGFFFSRKDHLYSFLDKVAPIESDFDDLITNLNYVTVKRTVTAREVLQKRVFDHFDELTEPIRLHLVINNTKCVFVISRNLRLSFQLPEIFSNHFPILCFFLDLQDDSTVFNQSHQGISVFENSVKLLHPDYADVRGTIGLPVDSNEFTQSIQGLPWETYGSNAFFSEQTNVENLLSEIHIPYSQIKRYEGFGTFISFYNLEVKNFDEYISFSQKLNLLRSECTLV